MVDVETDGEVPGLYSMISFGAVLVTPALDKTFYGQLRPLRGAGWKPEALAVSGHTREETLTFPHGPNTMIAFESWLKDVVPGAQPMFVSDNNGFDFMFVAYYFHRTLGYNPFGHSSTNLGSLYKGLIKTTTKNFKHLRKTRHTHHPVDDAKGNAEALLHMVNVMGLKVPGLTQEG